MNNKNKVWFNGKMIPWHEATVPLLSHGFSRGSAIFEVFGIHESPNGPVAFRMDEHLKRLMKSASLLGMEMAYSTNEIVKAVTETKEAMGVATVMVSRGSSRALGRGSSTDILKASARAYVQAINRIYRLLQRDSDVSPDKNTVPQPQ